MSDIIFFISSTGDTQLAKATALKLAQEQTERQIYLVPLADAAQQQLVGFEYQSITVQEFRVNAAATEDQSVAAINKFIAERNIQSAFVGVPSPVDEIMAYQVAKQLSVPFVLVLEFMFKPGEQHQLWPHLSVLQRNPNCRLAVPSAAALDDVQGTTASIIGHLSIDRAMHQPAVDQALVATTKSMLQLVDEQAYAFISGTTCPHDVDNDFLQALLTELNTGQYPQLQLRFGLHPGVKELSAYLESLLQTCQQFPTLAAQCKIILTPRLEQRLQQELADIERLAQLQQHSFILSVDISGPAAAAAADGVAQAVPGALTNQAALRGQSSYFHAATKPYLPQGLFADGIATFFHSTAEAERREPITEPSQLGLVDDCPTALVTVFNRL